MAKTNSEREGARNPEAAQGGEVRDADQRPRWPDWSYYHQTDETLCLSWDQMNTSTRLLYTIHGMLFNERLSRQTIRKVIRDAFSIFHWQWPEEDLYPESGKA